MDEIKKYAGHAPAKYTGQELAIIQAQLNSPKILSMSISAISEKCTDYLTKAYIDAGFQLPGRESMLILSGSVADDLFTYFKTLSLKEAGLAIQNGIMGEYGEFMGINVKTCHQFFKAYQESFNRNEVIRKQAMKEEIETKPTDQEIDNIMKTACITAFHKYRETSELIDFGGAKFTYLKKIGAITLTPGRYADIFERAKQQVIAESAQAVFKSGTDSTAGVIAKAIIQAPDKHEITKNAARLIALREYFDFLIENEFELSDLILNA